MKGCLTQRYKGSWSIVLDVGYQLDPISGTRKRKQRCITVKGTKRDAEKKLAELLHDVNRQQFVEPSKRTLGEWLEEWVEKAIKPAKALRTYEAYRAVIDRYLKPHLGGIRLQELKVVDLERYYAQLRVQRLERSKTDTGKGLSSNSIRQHHTALHSALEAALRDDLISRNPAKFVKGKPKVAVGHLDVQAHCWDVDEAKAFLRTAKAAGPQQGALYAVALDSGARKAELCGLRWSDLDWTAGTLIIKQQLSRSTTTRPVFGPTKNKKARVINLGLETVTLLRKHHAHQAELKMANRTTYHDHGLIFAKEWEDLQRHRYALGDPLQMTNTGQIGFARLMKAAGVRRITFHGLRHTCATLLLKGGVPPKVVQERLGHSRLRSRWMCMPTCSPACSRTRRRSWGRCCMGRCGVVYARS